MVAGVGVDIVEIDRIAGSIQNPRFLERVYTPGERAYCDSRGAQRSASYAARWAGKEAVLKAFGTGLRQGTLQEIEILPDTLGCPHVRLTGCLAELAADRAIGAVHISLSHARAFAVAQCIMEGTGR